MITHNVLAGKIASRPLSSGINRPAVKKQSSAEPSEFKKLLQQKTEAVKTETDLKFSKHAQKRLFSREINLKPEELKSLKEVVKKLETKGAKESLILMNRKSEDNLAVVVSVRNKTVITAMNSGNMKENIFTNIDSTVVL